MAVFFKVIVPYVAESDPPLLDGVYLIISRTQDTAYHHLHFADFALHTCWFRPEDAALNAAPPIFSPPATHFAKVVHSPAISMAIFLNKIVPYVTESIPPLFDGSHFAMSKNHSAL